VDSLVMEEIRALRAEAEAHDPDYVEEGIQWRSLLN
jgi:hypothetical protein